MAVARIDIAGAAGLESRVEVLENNEYKITYFSEINTASGAITIPTGATILLDQLAGGVDAYVSTIQNGQPTGNFPQTGSGVTVVVSSFDALGNYTLSGTPSGFPVALIYVLKIKAVDYSNLIISNILDLEDVDVFVPNQRVPIGTGTSYTSTTNFTHDLTSLRITNNSFNVNGNPPVIVSDGNGSHVLGLGYSTTVGARLRNHNGLLYFWATNGFFNESGNTFDMNASRIDGIRELRFATNSTPLSVNGSIRFDGTVFKKFQGGVETNL